MGEKTCRHKRHLLQHSGVHFRQMLGIIADDNSDQPFLRFRIREGVCGVIYDGVYGFVCGYYL